MSDWLLIDIDGADVQFARCSSAMPTAFTGKRSYSSRAFATATDCLLRYAADEDIALSGLTVAMVMSGPVTGDTVRIARCPWISIRGIGYLTRGDPVALNDSVAKAWANFHHSSLSHRLVGGAATALPPGPALETKRYVVINFRVGVGAAIFSTGPDASFHVESEMGHMSFAPENAVERALAAVLERRHAPVGWEAALLCAAMDPTWRDTPLAGDTRAIGLARAGMLGAFCGHAVLAGCTWGGALVHGNGRELLASAEAMAAFNTRFEARAGQTTTMRSVPRWTVTIEQENLVGAALYLKARREVALPAAA